MIGTRQWILLRRPTTLVQADDLALVETTLPDPGPGEVLIAVDYVSLDPGLQFFMATTQQVPGAVALGDVVSAWGVGRVIASRSNRFPVGAHVRDHFGQIGLRDHAIVHEDGLIAVDPSIAPLPAYLGVLGMPALTAYFGMTDIGMPVPGETVLISGASGAVGSVAGQIARIRGCRLVGLAGSPDKCRRVTDDLGFDVCLDYHAPDLAARLRTACPHGIDIYFDNVGGPLLSLAFDQMAMGGRIIFCGALADYGADASPPVKSHLNILTRGLRWQGLSVYRHVDRYDNALEELGEWVRDGRIAHREDISVGLERFVESFHRMFAGQSVGKAVLKLR